MIAWMLVAGCSGGGDESPADDEDKGYKEPERRLPCEIQALLEDHCWECHGDVPTKDAPMSLTSRTAFVGFAPNTRESLLGHVAVARMRDVADPMPPWPHAPVPPDRIDAFEAWFGDGNNPWQGDGSCEDEDEDDEVASTGAPDDCDPIAVLQERCSMAGCHAAEDPQAGLDLQSDGVQARLLGATAMGPACAGQPLAPAGDPGAGLFADKLGGAPSCGEPMPLDGPLSAAERQCLLDWLGGLAP